MDEYDCGKVRNLALVSHAGAGKTSLAEAILFNAGATTRLGKVDEGTTISDYNPDEIERKVSISATCLHCNWQDYKVQLIDTPGYADFVGEVIGGLRAVDAGIVLVDAVSGVEVGTERVWGFLDKLLLPRVIFVNKMEKENANFFRILDEIKERLGKRCISIQWPLGKESSFEGTVDLLDLKNIESLSDKDKPEAMKMRNSLVEGVAETDDSLLERYLEGAELDLGQIKVALKNAILRGDVVPILCGSATANLSIKPLLGAIVDYLPSCLERKPIRGTVPGTEEEKSIEPTESSPFSAQVFKTISDPYVGQLTVFRVFSGTLHSDTGFYNSTTETKERIGQIYILQGKEQRPVDIAHTGDIVAVAKLKKTFTGDSLCDEKNPVLFEPILFPEPAISASVKPKSRGDEEKISSALSKLTTEDPTFKVGREQQTKELIISGVGDLHLEVMTKKMRQRFGVEVEIGTPKVPYKETVTRIARVQGKYKRQSGGRGQYGDVWIQVEPMERGKDFEFVDKIVGGAIPRNYIPSVEKGVKEAMAEGVLAGYPITDVKITLYDGSYHTVDSSDIAFKIAGAMALRKGALEANPVLLEPIMDVEVIIPEEYMGQISGDLNARRGRIMGVEPRSRVQVIKAQVPLAEMFKYATELRSMTGGKGSYSMKFSHYEEVPQKISSIIASQAKKSQG